MLQNDCVPTNSYSKVLHYIQGKLLYSLPTDTQATVSSSAHSMFFLSNFVEDLTPRSSDLESPPAQMHPSPSNGVQSFSTSIVTIPSLLASDNSPMRGGPGPAIVGTFIPSPLAPRLLSHEKCLCPSTFLIAAHTLGNSLLNAVPTSLKYSLIWSSQSHL